MVSVFPGFIRTGSANPDADRGKPFLLDLDDGTRRILAAIDREQAVVHFPWPLSPLMRCVIRHLPAAAYDALVGRMAGRRPEGATRAGDGRG